MSIKLYQLNEAYQNIINLDLDEDALKLAVDSIQSEVGVKAENIAIVLRTLEAENNAYKAEIERFKALAKSNDSKINYLKSYLSQTLQDMNIDKLSTDKFKFSFRKSQAVKITDEKLIPKEFIKTKVVESINKTDLKTFLKNGGDVAGATLVTNQNLQIK